jgi:hypothetical protein
MNCIGAGDRHFAAGRDAGLGCDHHLASLIIYRSHVISQS